MSFNYVPCGDLGQMAMPLSHDSQWGLKLRHNPAVDFVAKRIGFWDSTFVGRLRCHVIDDFDDVGDDEPTFVYAMSFCPHEGLEHFLAVANEDGVIMIQNTYNKGGEDYIELKAHSNAIFDIAWRPHEIGHLASASGDQTVCVWETVNHDESTLLRQFKGYARSVKCVEFAPDHPDILATGSRGNAIILWDMREPSDTRPALAIRGAHSHNNVGLGTHRSHSSSKATLSSSVTAIQFQSEHKLVSSSDTDGIIKVWDLRRSYDRYRGEPVPQHSFPYPGKTTLKGYTSLVLDSTSTRLYASCKDNHIYTFDMASYEEKAIEAYSGYENGCKFFIRMSLSCDDRYLACGSSDNYAYIWNVKDVTGSSEPIYRLTGHESEVTCVEWSKNIISSLATCSDEMKHRIWRFWIDDDLDPDDIRGTAEKLTSAPLLKSAPVRRQSPERNDENVAPNRWSAFPSTVALTPTKKTVPKKLTMVSPTKYAMSPTANLPNFVLDGKSPHRIVDASSGGSASKKRRVDWLTSLSRQKKMAADTPKTKELSLSNRPSPAKRCRAKRSLHMNTH